MEQKNKNGKTSRTCRTIFKGLTFVSLESQKYRGNISEEKTVWNNAENVPDLRKKLVYTLKNLEEFQTW